MYIGISYAGSDSISLLVEVMNIRNDDTIEFYVLNGAWEGTFKDNIVHVIKTEDDIPAEILWYGCLSKGCKDYNDAIKYVNDEVLKSQHIPNMTDVLTDFRKYLAEVEESYEDEIPF
jgi:hypothetical protein